MMAFILIRDATTPLGLWSFRADGTFWIRFAPLTVTSVSVPLLAFAWYEGVLVSFLSMRHGVLPAALAHGLAVFFLASGLL